MQKAIKKSLHDGHRCLLFQCNAKSLLMLMNVGTYVQSVLQHIQSHVESHIATEMKQKLTFAQS